MIPTLVEDLKYWRAERPDEWMMDRFIKAAIKQQSQLRLLAELILKNHAGDDWITQYSDNPGVCVCEGCVLAREILN